MSDWFKAEFHAERAHQFYESGQWEKALAELKLALAVNPNQPDWRLGMGLTLDAMERYEEAIDCFKQVLELRGDDVQTMLLLGYDLIRADRPGDAVDILEQVNRLDPECEAGYCHRTLAYTQMGNHQRAEEMFYRARQVVEECPNCFDNIAHSLAARGMIDKAIWCWQQAIRLDPHYPEAYANLARVHWHKGQPERAYQYFLQQLRDDPGDIGTLLEMGRLLVELGRQAEAGEKFRRVLELDPAVADAHLHLGELAIFSGHLDAAQASLEMAGRIDPNRAGVHLCLAQVAQKRGQLNGAMAHLRAELARDGRTVNQTLELARVLIELRQSEQVPAPLAPLLEPPEPPELPEPPEVSGMAESLDGSDDSEFVNHPRNDSSSLKPQASSLKPYPDLDDQRLATTLLYRGVARMLGGDGEGGIADCREALHYSPRQALAMYNLALAYLEQGRLTRARYWLKKAAALRPDDPQIRQLRVRLLRANMARSIHRIVAAIWR